MQELLLTYQSLPPQAQQTLLAFLDFLWQKEQQESTQPDADPFSAWSTISTWSEADVRPIEEAGEWLNQWQPLLSGDSDRWTA